MRITRGSRSWQVGNQRHRVAVQDGVHDRELIVDVVGRCRREQLVDDQADREDVASARHGLPGNLLRRHVPGRPDQRADLGGAGVPELGDAEIEDFQRAFAVHHDVGRLDIAVDDAGFVRVLEAEAKVPGQLHAAGKRHRRAGADQLQQRLAVHVLHDDERLSRVIAVFVEGDDEGMPERRDGPRFFHEPAAQIGRVEPGAHQFDRHEPLERGIAGEIHDAHTAFAQAVGHLVAADVQRSGGRLGRVRHVDQNTPNGRPEYSSSIRWRRTQIRF